MENKLKELEYAILEEIASYQNGKYSVISDIAKALLVKNRSNSKNGIVVEFEYSAPIVLIMKDEFALEALLSTDKIVSVAGLKHGLGYVLDIEEGRLYSLEIYPIDINEVWDREYSEFTFIDKV